MNQLLFLLAALLPADVQLTTLDGKTQTGELQQISETDVTLQLESGPQTVPLAQVLNIARSRTTEPAISAGGTILLRDDSRIIAEQIRKDATGVSGLAAFGPVAIPADQVLAVRLQPDTEQYRDQWRTFRERDTEKDLLVVLKRDRSGLDFLAGVVSDISEEQLSFLLDGDSVPVPLSRVFGVVFGRNQQEGRPPRSSVRVDTISGDLLMGRSIVAAEGIWTLETLRGDKLQGRLDQLQSIDLSSGQFVMLADHQPLQEEFSGADPRGSVTAVILGEDDIAFPEEEQLFRPRRNQNQAGQPLRMRQREYRSGLCLHSRTQISWPLDREFESLQAVVGIDDEVAYAMEGKNSVRLIVKADQDVVLDTVIAGRDEPRSLTIPLAGASTLTVLVDYGDGNSLCDWLDLGDARLKIIRTTESR